MRLSVALVALALMSAPVFGEEPMARNLGIGEDGGPPKPRAKPNGQAPQKKDILSEEEKRALREWVEKDMTPEARRSWEEAERDPEKALEKDARAARERERRRQFERQIFDRARGASEADI